MIITCENCGTKFQLDQTLLETGGSRVRCSLCRWVFLAYPPKDEALNSSQDSAADGERFPAGRTDALDLADLKGASLHTGSSTAAAHTESDDSNDPSRSVGDAGDPGSASIEEVIQQAVYATGPVRKVRPSLWVLLGISAVLGLLYGGLYIAHIQGVAPALTQKFRLPVFGSSVPSGDVSATNNKVVTYDISSKFIDNIPAGRLFVISGNLRNDSPQPQGLIQVTGKLYKQDGVVVATESVYGGNALSDLDLRTMDMGAIRRKLNHRFGGNRKVNVNVAPGQSVPFMVVFDDPPQALEEFKLTVSGSISMSATP